MNTISAFDCVREHCPAYFGISGRANPRSAERHDMLVPLTRTQLGRRSFCVASPAVCNPLSPHLQSSSINRGQFRAGLKPISSHRPTDMTDSINRGQFRAGLKPISSHRPTDMTDSINRGQFRDGLKPISSHRPTDMTDNCC